MTQKLEVPTTATELSVVLRASGLDASKTQVLSSRFADYFTIAQQWEQEAQGLVVSDEGQTELMKRARQGRLVLRDKRVQIEHTRKELKEESLKEGRAIDAVAKLLTGLIAPTEDFLLLQEEFAVRAAKQRLQERDKLIQGRRRLLQEYADNEGDACLAELSDHAFDIRLQTAERCFTKKEEQQAAQRDAQRKADQRSRDELLRHNQELEAQLKRDQELAASERRQLEGELQKQQDEFKQARDFDAKRRREAEQRQHTLNLVAAAAPDRQKLSGLADRIGQLSLELPTLTTPGGQEIVDAVGTLLGKVQHFIREKSDTL